jgi:hypothetical protein
MDFSNTSNASVDAQSSSPQPKPDTSVNITNGWRWYKKFVKTGFDAVGLKDKIQDNGDDVEGTYHMGDIAAAIPILATVGIIGGVAARRRSKKSKTVKSMSDTFQSGLSTLKSLQSLSFGRKRKSRRKSHKRSHVRKFGKRKSHKRKSHKR